ncbi:MAG: efflux RND transporter periplasmic adaptor subunit [Desulfamplus sp.]|nr:efflux RND transporter periplasmic adaptor subunit [Desulfamplus sp.]
MYNLKHNFNQNIIVFIAMLLSALFVQSTLLSISFAQEPDGFKQKKIPYSPIETVKSSVQTVTETYTAVGTVKPKSETMIESQVNAQVQKVHVQAGDKVNKGDILITLDDRQASSRRDGANAALNAARAGKEQAMQGVNAAEAAHKEAKLQYDRVSGYYKSQAATKQELEMAESGYVQAKAALKRAKDALAGAEAGIRQAMGAVSETNVGLEFSKITAPATGEVIKRMVEPGDLAMPGKPLISLRTETGFRIEAHVREGLINKVKIGMKLKAEIATLGVTCDAEVEEIIPYADPETRTFLIKATLPKDIKVIANIYPGMYAKLLIPESTKEVVLLPSKAVIISGQLELVMVQIGGDKTEQNGVKNQDSANQSEPKNREKNWQLRYIKTGRHSGDMVEVLSGLKGDEIVGVGGFD